LAALVKAEMGDDPFSGTIYMFRAKRTDLGWQRHLPGCETA
jgi:hypothetical protein